jgi:hypothetical protein
MRVVRPPILVLAMLGTAACGPTPTESTATTTTIGQFPQEPNANVHASGSLTIQTCADGQCGFEGEVTNDGPDCASNIKGITHLFDESDQELESRSWVMDGRLRRGVPRPFVGCCFSQSIINAYRRSRTDVTFDPLLCI